MTAALEMWTIYEKPRDFPHSYVARAFLIDRDGPQPTDRIIVGPDLERIRELLIGLGMSGFLPREEGDDPNIVETWL